MVLVFLIVCVACCCKYGYANSMDAVRAADQKIISGIEEESSETRPIPEIVGYRVCYGQADGSNGYYRNAPQIELVHQDAEFETHYCLIYPDGREEEGVLKEKGSSRKWEALEGDGLWKLRTELVLCEDNGEEQPDVDKGDGNYSGEDKEDENQLGIESGEAEATEEEKTEAEESDELPDGSEDMDWEEVWKEFEKNLAGWKKEYEWKVDGIVPTIQIISPQNRNIWYQKAVTVQINASDTGSGIQKFQARTGGRSYVSKNKRDLIFQVNEESRNGRAVNIDIEITDNAGNTVQKTMELYIDQVEPEVEISGIDSYQISSKNIEITLSARDNNGIYSLEGRIEHTSPEGEKRSSKVELWTQTLNGKMAEVVLEQEGIYRIEIIAVDVAGHRCTEDKQLIIDKTPPEIHLPNELDKSIRQEFCLQEDFGSLVTDFTTVFGQAELDGRLFHSGEVVTKEGKHTFLFKAVDAAGNQSEERAEFMIDRTAPVICILAADTGKEVSDGAICEESLQFCVTTQEREDKVRSVWINGEQQKSQGDNRGFRYMLKDAGTYEIRVEAYDAAGNIGSKTLAVQVKIPEIAMEQMTIPTMKMLKKIMDGTGGVEGEERDIEAEQARTGWAWLVAFCVIIVGTILVVIRVRKRFEQE